MLELLPLDKKSKQVDPCATASRENSLLLINLNTKIIGLKYFNLIKTLAQKGKTYKIPDSEKECLNFRIYLLKEKSFLFFDSQNSLQQYAGQISKTIQKIVSVTEKKLNIISSEEGSALTMKALLNLYQEETFAPLISEKLDMIVMINLYNRITSFQKQPIAVYLDKLKHSILKDTKMLKIFNSFKLIMINTLREQYQLLNQVLPKNSFQQQDPAQSEDLDLPENQFSNFPKLPSLISSNFFVFEKDKHFSIIDSNIIDQLQINQSQQLDSTQLKGVFERQDEKYLALQKSHIIHTRQISNIHSEFKNGDYFTYQPFLDFLTEFTTESFKNQLSQKAISYFFKYGETHSKFVFETMSKIGDKECVLYRLHFQQPSLWYSRKKCFKLTVNSTISEMAHIIYSDEGNFDMYSDSLVKLSEHDKNLQKSVFLLQKITHQLLIYNPKGHKIIVVSGQIFSPSHPLTEIFSEFQILYMSQIDQKSLYEDQNSRKFAVRTCTNNLLIFPDDFPVGKYHRQFLLQKSHSQCYHQLSSYWQFIGRILDYELLCKNLIIFILFVGFVKRRPIEECKKVTFICVVMLLWYTELKTYHILLILFIACIIEKGLNFLCTMSSCIQIDRTKVFICMILMFFVVWACERFLFQQYDYWKIMLIFLIFFINQENATIIAVKLYYIQDYIMYGEYDWMEIAQLVMFMKVTQLTTEGKDEKKSKKHGYFSLDFLMKIILVFGLAIGLVFYPESAMFHTIITCYMKAKIFYVSFKKLT